MEKRLFQKLDEMNVADGENNTMHLQVCSSLVEAKTAKGGGHIVMGVPAQIIHEIVIANSKMCVLLVIDKNEYERLASNQSS